MTIPALLQKFKALDTDAITHETLEAKKEDLIEYNQAQFYGGEDKLGPITPEYTPLTVFLKHQKGQPTDRVTLYDTGEFYQGFYITVGADRLTESSTDPKTAKIVNKYDLRFGLNTPYKNTFIRELLRPEFNRRITAATGLKFK